MEVNDEHLWEQVMEEVGGPERRAGLWAKCFAQSNGDEARAKAAYMTARVDEIKADREREQAKAKADAIQEEGQRWASTSGTCPSCGKVIPLQSTECKYCRALFGPDSAWSIRPLSETEMRRLASENGSTTAIEPPQQEPHAQSPATEALGQQGSGFDFGYEGRIGRQTYLVASLIIGLVSGLLYGVALSADAPAMAALVLVGMTIAQSMPNAQRLHDVNYSGWTQLLGMIPLVNLFIAAMLFFRKGTPGPNRYGPDPLAD